MKKGKIIALFSTLAGMAAAGMLFFNWNPEFIFRGKETKVAMADIEQNADVDFTGSAAGEDIPRISGKEEFETIYSGAYTIEPAGIVSTGTYELKAWVEPYRTRRTRKGRAYGAPVKKPQYLQYDNPDSGFWNSEDYLPFYLLELPDGTYILAQIPKSDADAVRRGKSVVLPIGKKKITGLPASLKELCEEYGASTSGVFYAFSDEWYQKYYFPLFLIRAGASAVVLFASAVLLMTIGNKVFGVSEQE